MYSYKAYDLCIHSELPLPELGPVNPDREPDIVIYIGRPDLLAQNGKEETESISAETGVGTLAIRAKREVFFDPTPSVKEAVIRTFLLGPIMAILLRLQGFLVLHASAVATDTGSIIFLGDSGSGKSTLAETFFSKGYQFIADDVTAIQASLNCPFVLPSYPQTKLWPDAAESLGYNPQRMPLLHSQVSKRVHRLTSGFCDKPMPLSHIYVLGPVDTQHQIETLQPREAFLELVRCSRAMSIPAAPHLDRKHFHQCAKLVRQVPVSLLKRQRSLSALPNLASLIEEDLAHKNSRSSNN